MRSTPTPKSCIDTLTQWNPLEINPIVSDALDVKCILEKYLTVIGNDPSNRDAKEISSSNPPKKIGAFYHSLSDLMTVSDETISNKSFQEELSKVLNVHKTNMQANSLETRYFPIIMHFPLYLVGDNGAAHFAQLQIELQNINGELTATIKYLDHSAKFFKGGEIANTVIAQLKSVFPQITISADKMSSEHAKPAQESGQQNCCGHLVVASLFNTFASTEEKNNNSAIVDLANSTASVGADSPILQATQIPMLKLFAASKTASILLDNNPNLRLIDELELVSGNIQRKTQRADMNQPTAATLTHPPQQKPNVASNTTASIGAGSAWSELISTGKVSKTRWFSAEDVGAFLGKYQAVQQEEFVSGGQIAVSLDRSKIITSQDDNVKHCYGGLLSSSSPTLQNELKTILENYKNALVYNALNLANGNLPLMIHFAYHVNGNHYTNLQIQIEVGTNGQPQATIKYLDNLGQKLSDAQLTVIKNVLSSAFGPDILTNNLQVKFEHAKPHQADGNSCGPLALAALYHQFAPVTDLNKAAISALATHQDSINDSSPVMQAARLAMLRALMSAEMMQGTDEDQKNIKKKLASCKIADAADANKYGSTVQVGDIIYPEFFEPAQTVATPQPPVPQVSGANAQGQVQLQPMIPAFAKPTTPQQQSTPAAATITPPASPRPHRPRPTTPPPQPSAPPPSPSNASFNNGTHLDVMPDPARAAAFRAIADAVARTHFTLKPPQGYASIKITAAEDENREPQFKYDAETKKTTFEYQITFQPNAAPNDTDKETFSIIFTATPKIDDQGNHSTDWKIDIEENSLITWEMACETLAAQEAFSREQQIPALRKKITDLGALPSPTEEQKKELAGLKKDLYDFTKKEIGVVVTNDDGQQQNFTLLNIKFSATQKEFEAIQAHLKYFDVVTFGSARFENKPTIVQGNTSSSFFKQQPPAAATPAANASDPKSRP